MTAAIALSVWVTVTVGLYLALSRDVLRCVLGLAVLGAGANLVLFASGRLGSPLPAVVPLGQSVLGESGNPRRRRWCSPPSSSALRWCVFAGAGAAADPRCRQRRCTGAALRRAAERRPVKPPQPQPGCEPAWPPSELPQEPPR